MITGHAELAERLRFLHRRRLCRQPRHGPGAGAAAAASARSIRTATSSAAFPRTPRWRIWSTTGRSTSTSITIPRRTRSCVEVQAFTGRRCGPDRARDRRHRSQPGERSVGAVAARCGAICGVGGRARGASGARRAGRHSEVPPRPQRSRSDQTAQATLGIAAQLEGERSKLHVRSRVGVRLSLGQTRPRFRC